MAEHPIPERVSEVVIADIVARIAEHGIERPDEADRALSVLRALPTIEDGAELEIRWASGAYPAAGASFHLSDRNLTLSIADEDGTQEIYDCDAGSYPRVDHDDFEAWIKHFSSLGAPTVAISLWMPPARPEPEGPTPTRRSEIKLAEIRHDRFYSAVSLELKADGSLRMLVYDTGEAPTACFGSDYDRWVDVGEQAKDALLLALLEDKYRGNTNAVNELKEFCESKGVPHNYDVY